MDWTKYANIYTFVKLLPEDNDIDLSFDKSFQQTITYPIIKNPIQTIQRKPIFFKKEEYTSSFTSTKSIWQQVVSYFDETYSISSPSLKQDHLQFFMHSLKNYITDPVLFKFLSGRRGYPLLELLDKPKVELQKKHVNALGYILSFLLDQIVYINEKPYEWKEDLLESNLKINIKGFSQ
jgi:hypothetical protein